MMTTYNQLIDIFKQIAGKHSFIARFGSGQLESITASDDEAYPMLYVIPQSADIGSQTLTYKMRVLVFDIDDTDDSKQQQILSDTLRTLSDVIKDFRIGTDPSIYLDSDPTAIPFAERFTDYCSGWYADLDIIAEIDNSPCTLPYE